MPCLDAVLLAGMPVMATMTTLSVPHEVVGTIGTVLAVWLAVSIPIGMLVGHMALDGD